VNASLILLPLPLSSIPDPELLNALSQLSQSKDQLNLLKGRPWSEDDDEPFMQLGMGAGKRKEGKGDIKREVDGMYM